MSLRPLLGLVFATGLPLAAQTFTVTPSTIEGVELIGPSSPRFAPLADQFIGPEAKQSPLIASTLPLLVFANLTGSRKVVLFSVRYDFSVDGTPRHHVHTQETRNGFVRGPQIVTPLGPITQAIRDGNTGRLVQGQSSHFRTLSTLTASPEIAVSLDGVVYDDGEFVGADRSETFLYLRQERAQVQAIAKEFRDIDSMTDQAILARLAVIANAPPERTPGGRGVFRQRLVADSLRARLTAGGREAFRDGLRLYQEQYQLEIWRR
jgi:hypothetical protein